MKKQLIQLAKEKGFISNVIGKSVDSKHSKKDFYYLWMCELQKWLRDNYNKYIKVHPVFRNNKVIYEFIIFLLDERLKDTDSFKNIMSLHIEPYYWDKYEQALEKGLQETLKLI